MKLYYLQGACSLASLISLLEAGTKFEAVAVDRKTRKLPDGRDYAAVNPKGYVPALELDDGEVLTENTALLPYIADLNPSANLAPPVGTRARFRLQEWLGYLNGEVHKNFSPLFNPAVPEAMKQIAKDNIARRLALIEDRIGDQPFLLGEAFSVADAYLYVILSWRQKLGVDISAFPKVTALYERIRARPSVQAARKAEGLND
ncbi:glutathione transferase GstA [Steroidobacter sp.]|uniref:glutathione transferase GstA n=1 Tax=Steroidobacter sp. TaxID=1978227 RepID=UPI001A61B1DA|nr:glutathione transferase GstA [Steroidobacter sp.]MBL8271132.1 glutathione transferase GstA [Steroidobacter sp.]